MFFKHVPQLPRMIQRTTFLHRIRLIPSHPDFPHASLLHAISASAAAHTARVSSINPEALEQATLLMGSNGIPPDFLHDFGLAQAYAAKQSIDSLAVRCTAGSSRSIFQVTQASVSGEMTRLPIDRLDYSRRSLFREGYATPSAIDEQYCTGTHQVNGAR